MSNPINILLDNIQNIGSITFMPPGNAFGAVRTAAGFRLEIPAMLDFRGPNSQKPVQIDDLTVTLSVHNGASPVEIGTARCKEILTSGIMKRPISFLWDWPLAALIFYERLRDGKEPSFQVTVTGKLYFLLPAGPDQQTRTAPSIFQDSGTVAYSRESWVNTLRQLNMHDAVIAEIPFPAAPPNGWEPVWSALRDARNGFDTGGSTGWRNCVGSVRLALEEWQKTEKEECGPGGVNASHTERTARDKRQRAEFLRWSLLQYAHYGPHTNADGWTRDDALLALSSFCALIAIRNP